MKQKLYMKKWFVILCAAMVLVSSVPATSAKAAELTASTSVNRASGECYYAVQGIDLSMNDSISLKVIHKSTNVSAYEKTIALTSTNCANGTYSDKFSLDDVKNNMDEYSVSITCGDKTITAGNCDFSVHASKLTLKANGTTSDASRSFVVTSSEATGEVAVPGKNNTVSVLAWPQSAAESTAKTLITKQTFSNEVTMNADVSQAGTAYGTWNAKVILDATGKTLASTTYDITPTMTSLVVKNSKTLEKKKAFGVTIDGLKNTYGIKSLAFRVYNSKGKKVATITGTKKKADGSKYYADITMKKLGYVLDNYTIKAALTDNNGTTKLMSASTIAYKKVKKGMLSITKKNNATCVFKLKNAYIPGNIQKVKFVLYKKNKKQGTYVVKKTAGKSSISYTVRSNAVGKYTLYAYGVTAWGKEVLITKNSYQLSKKHLGKNGWVYEKFAGKKYKVFYVNNVKQVDVTKELKLKKNNASNTNKFYIEVNRAASAVTIYLYNEDTEKYDIPVKTCSVSVGADTWTKAGTSGLNEKSSYTPLGMYSVCTNGQSVKYTLKPMHEPDGSIVYARWATHIVGNVYFHSIAVGGKSHYSLPSSTYNRLGSPCSAGCIRMTVADAKWIYDYVATGTKVKINVGNSKKAGPLGKAPVIKTTSGINYDPTDPAVPDSRKKKDYKAKKITGYMTKSGKKVGY